MSDREGHGHKAVVYKSHFPATKALHSHSVVTETPADTLANKPRLLQRPSSLFFMPPRQKQLLKQPALCNVQCVNPAKSEKSSLKARQTS